MTQNLSSISTKCSLQDGKTGLGVYVAQFGVNSDHRINKSFYNRTVSNPSGIVGE